MYEQLGQINPPELIGSIHDTLAAMAFEDQTLLNSLASEAARIDKQASDKLKSTMIDTQPLLLAYSTRLKEIQTVLQTEIKSNPEWSSLLASLSKDGKKLAKYKKNIVKDSGRFEGFWCFKEGKANAPEWQKILIPYVEEVVRLVEERTKAVESCKQSFVDCSLNFYNGIAELISQYPTDDSKGNEFLEWVKPKSEAEQPATETQVDDQGYSIRPEFDDVFKQNHQKVIQLEIGNVIKEDIEAQDLVSVIPELKVTERRRKPSERSVQLSIGSAWSTNFTPMSPVLLDTINDSVEPAKIKQGSDKPISFGDFFDSKQDFTLTCKETINTILSNGSPKKLLISGQITIETTLPLSTQIEFQLKNTSRIAKIVNNPQSCQLEGFKVKTLPSIQGNVVLVKYIVEGIDLPIVIYPAWQIQGNTARLLIKTQAKDSYAGLAFTIKTKMDGLSSAKMIPDGTCDQMNGTLTWNGSEKVMAAIEGSNLKPLKTWVEFTTSKLFSGIEFDRDFVTLTSSGEYTAEDLIYE